MNKFRFKSEDFRNTGSTQLIYYNYTPEAAVLCSEAADRANQILDEHLAKCPVVYGYLDGATLSDVTEFKYEGADHKAVLFNIEELMKEPCKHEPKWVGHPHLSDCKHCGIKLKATWEAAE